MRHEFSLKILSLPRRGIFILDFRARHIHFGFLRTVFSSYDVSRILSWGAAPLFQMFLTLVTLLGAVWRNSEEGFGGWGASARGQGWAALKNVPIILLTAGGWRALAG